MKLDEIKGYGKVKLAMAIAVATKQNLLIYGSQQSKKNKLAECMQELLPELTDAEKSSTYRIWSIAGLMPDTPDGSIANCTLGRPFRIPHCTASIEGMFGGGASCRPGEISLAHNGVLLLEDAPEFRTSILTMLTVPLERKAVTLERAGRSTIFPADFQLVMTANPCPCGSYGETDKQCLCGSRSISQYWKKLKVPMSKIGIKVHADPNDTTDYTVEELKEFINFPMDYLMED